MVKGCCLCELNAEFVLKGTTDYYCKDCALDFFGDVGLLLPLEEEAAVLKRFVEEKMRIDSDGQYVVNEEKKVKKKIVNKKTTGVKKKKATVKKAKKKLKAKGE